MADLTIRDWMVVIGALLILAVLLDAWRRVYQDRRAPVRMKIVDNGKGDEERGEREVDITWLRELPNGGARVVERGEDGEILEDPDYDQDEEQPGDRASAPEPRPAGNNRNSHEPIDRPEPAVSQARNEPPQQNENPQRRESSQPKESPQPKHSPRPKHSPQPSQSRESTPSPAVSRSAGEGRRVPPETKPARPGSVPSPKEQAEEVDLLAGVSSTDEPENLDWLDALEAEQKKAKQGTASQVSAQLPREVEPEVFMLNVVARHPGGFRGEDILHILLACDLRFGDMNFFHRHEQEAGRGPIQFSVANMMQPGVFDIDNMSDFSTTGLVFFLTLPGPEDMMKAFDYMLETAQVVARNLEGDVLDETRSVLTRQTLEHNRQQIRDLERRLLAKAH